MNEESLEKRIIDLEIRYMQQESTLQALNDVIVSQQREIEDLGRLISRLKEQVAAAVTSPLRDPSEEEPPPHY